jgi:hypothetical protein
VGTGSGFINEPKPLISVTNLAPNDPFNPDYYDFGWSALFTNTNGCQLRTDDQVVGGGLYAGYAWYNLPATSAVQIFPRYSDTVIVYYELSCTGSGGTSKVNGALEF